MSILFRETANSEREGVQALGALLRDMEAPFGRGDRVGIKLHWGERGNRTHLPPFYARQIARWLIDQGAKPFVFDTSVLYSGGRRTGKDSLETAARHGYTPAYLGCEVLIADGLDGRSVVDLPCAYKHFKSVQAGEVFSRAEGFVIFSTSRPTSRRVSAGPSRTFPWASAPVPRSSACTRTQSPC